MRFHVRLLDLADRADALPGTRAHPAPTRPAWPAWRGKARFLVVRAEGLKAPAANILKQEMLSVGADAAVSRGVINCSVPTHATPFSWARASRCAPS